ncbi:hypothetical protein ACO2WT_09935, partial [Ligilactobacillus salivarius]|uniref:hypothetical protein n=1 Tax=Ligilactobacillus salivarius TaxID=1624 RepID=UPI003C117A3F
GKENPERERDPVAPQIRRAEAEDVEDVTQGGESGADTLTLRSDLPASPNIRLGNQSPTWQPKSGGVRPRVMPAPSASILLIAGDVSG